MNELLNILMTKMKTVHAKRNLWRMEKQQHQHHYRIQSAIECHQNGKIKL